MSDEQLSDLELVRSEAPPRRAACARLVGRIDSLFGFIAYGVLWLFVAAMVSMGVLFAGVAFAGHRPSGAYVTAVLVGWALSFVLAWVPFGLWVRRRRQRARALVRDGLLVDGTIDGVLRLMLRGAPFTRGTLAIEGRAARGTFSVGGHHAELVEGATMPVLVAPGAAYGLVFAADGRVTATKLSAPPTRSG